MNKLPQIVFHQLIFLKTEFLKNFYQSISASTAAYKYVLVVFRPLFISARGILSINITVAMSFTSLTTWDSFPQIIIFVDIFL